MQKLYCPECGEYLEGGDGSMRDCLCGWRQPEDRPSNLQETESNADLLPCPFCGAVPDDEDVSEYFVECPSCGIEGPAGPMDSRFSAIEAWNTRHNAEVKGG